MGLLTALVVVATVNANASARIMPEGGVVEFYMLTLIFPVFLKLCNVSGITTQFGFTWSQTFFPSIFLTTVGLSIFLFIYTLGWIELTLKNRFKR